MDGARLDKRLPACRRLTLAELCTKYQLRNHNSLSSNFHVWTLSTSCTSHQDTLLELLLSTGLREDCGSDMMPLVLGFSTISLNPIS